jgi:hypothetical protein
MVKQKGKTKKRVPCLSNIDNDVRVREAFKYLTTHKSEYIIYENGRPLDIKEAIRRYKQTKEDKWLLHVLVSNMGYFANTLSKVAAKYKIDPCDYVVYVYEGLKYSADKCDADRVGLSYLAAGVYIICARQADRELRKKTGELNLEDFVYEDDEHEIHEGIAKLDMLLADFGIYDVPLYDEDIHEAHGGRD